MLKFRSSISDPKNFKTELQNLLRKFDAELYVEFDEHGDIHMKIDIPELSRNGHIIREAMVIDLGANL